MAVQARPHGGDCGSPRGGTGGLPGGVVDALPPADVPTTSELGAGGVLAALRAYAASRGPEATSTEPGVFVVKVREYRPATGLQSSSVGAAFLVGWERAGTGHSSEATLAGETWRTAADLAWLFQALNQELPGAIVPPCPSRKSLASASGSHAVEQVGKFLTRAVGSPVLGAAKCLELFITENDPVQWHKIGPQWYDAADTVVKGAVEAVGLGVVASVGSSAVESAHAAAMYGGPDAETHSALVRYARELDSQLAALEDTATQLRKGASKGATALSELQRVAERLERWEERAGGTDEARWQDFGLLVDRLVAFRQVQAGAIEASVVRPLAMARRLARSCRVAADNMLRVARDAAASGRRRDAKASQVQGTKGEQRAAMQELERLRVEAEAAILARDAAGDRLARDLPIFHAELAGLVADALGELARSHGAAAASFARAAQRFLTPLATLPRAVRD